MPNETVTLKLIDPKGVYAEESLVKDADKNGINYYAKRASDYLVGRTIVGVSMQNFESQVQTVLHLGPVIKNRDPRIVRQPLDFAEVSAAVMMDGEGNGPGELHMFDKQGRQL